MKSARLLTSSFLINDRPSIVKNPCSIIMLATTERKHCSLSLSLFHFLFLSSLSSYLHLFFTSFSFCSTSNYSLCRQTTPFPTISPPPPPLGGALEYPATRRFFRAISRGRRKSAAKEFRENKIQRWKFALEKKKKKRRNEGEKLKLN